MFPLLLLLYGLSGAAALVYQVLWVRLLGLTFGVTVYAAATVLASFMAGLASGSALGGRLADRTRNPLRTFGLIELGAGITALASPVLLDAVQALFIRWHPGTSDGDLRLTLLRFFLSAIVLIVPAMLMGATLPMIVRAARAYAGHAARLGVLYGTNTIGAMMGTLAAGLWMVPALGMTRSFLLAAGLNAAIGLTAVVVSRKATAIGEADGPVDTPAGQAALVLPPRWTIAVIVLLSGFVTLALEVVWFRVLAAIILRPTTYAFTIMLAAVLGGIGLGSYVAGIILRRSRRWGLWLAAAEVGTGVLALLSFRGMAWSFEVMRWTEAFIARYLPDHLAPLLVGTFVSIFPAALMMGIALPIALAAWTAGSAGHQGRRLGNLYALNVAGSIAGSLAGGFVLLPLLGSHRSLVLLSLLMIAGAFLLLLGLERRWQAALAVSGITLGALGVATLPNLNEVVLPLRYTGMETLWRKEGIQTTVTVQQGSRRVLLLNGLHQANDSVGMVAFHKHLALLPLALHPNPRTFLSVGLGGGATPGGASQYPGLDIDVVELSSAVVEGASFFSHVNNDVLRQPHVRVMVGDGRTHLMVTRRKYDVVTADAIIPTHAGAGALYSADYYRLVKNVLTPSGLVAQWVGPTGTEQWKMLVRTFLSVFPDATLWTGSILIGGHGPLRIDPGAISMKEAEPRLMALLGRDGTLPLDTLLTRMTAGPDELRAFVGEGPILTDDQPRVEYFLSLPEDDPDIDLGPLKGDARRLLKK
ncbi:MAG TPA: fused MFS/spermidine synthase [Vicinamibacterales bacterium]|nr:fused MFS/spermidine synthase [Vicinamibacterales bacterium]